MKNKVIKLLAAGVLVVAGAFGMLAPSTYAVDGLNCDEITLDSLKEAAGCNNGGSGDAVQETIANILRAVIGMAGFVAVIFIVVGGVNYMTSAGDASKVKKAKDTILYAVIGLVICALAFAIVNWTIGIIDNGTSNIDIPQDNIAFFIK